MADYIDGIWVRRLADGALEIRDPNSGQSRDPQSKPRHQYRVVDWLLLRRVLPPAAVGDRWADDDVDEPWWEPVLELPADGPLLYFWRERAAGSMTTAQYAWQAHYAAGHVVAYTPNGREVRYAAAGGLEVQSPNDNYWLRAADLPAIRRAYYGAGA
jgi:hypothetical protein